MVGLSLVTGGCGFIGRHLVDALVARGERVRVLDLRPLDPAPAGVEQVVGSITDAALVERAVAGCDRVFHLAANPNLWAPDSRSFDLVNHQGTRRMLEAAQKANVRRFVYTSTESILKSYRAPRQSTRALIDESVVLTLADMPGPYCRSKFLAEEAAREAATGGLAVVIVNPTMPIGPGDHLLTPPSKMILGFLNGETPAYLDCEFNLVDARDVALGQVLAAEKGRVGERYILGNVNLGLADLLAARRSGLGGLMMPVVEKTTQITAMIFLILIGATLFSLVFRALGGDAMVNAALSDLPGGVNGAVLAVMLAMFLLGFVMDAFEIIFVVVPIVAPALLAMPGVDPVWLGILMAVNLQTSYMHPPLGPTLFYLRGVAPPEITTKHIYVGIVPFVLIQLCALVLLWFVPGLATLLPHALYGR